jgi:hypothetical protein
MAPASYATSFGADSSQAHQKAKQATYTSFLTAIGIDPLNYVVDVIPANNREGGVASGTINYNSTINNVDLYQVPLSNVSELNT